MLISRRRLVLNIKRWRRQLCINQKYLLVEVVTIIVVTLRTSAVGKNDVDSDRFHLLLPVKLTSTAGGFVRYRKGRATRLPPLDTNIRGVLCSWKGFALSGFL